MRILALCLFTLCLSSIAPPRAAAEEHGIGNFGATVELEKSWKRQTIDPDLGKDQFIYRSGGLLGGRKTYYAAILEVEQVFETKAECSDQLDVFIQSVGGKATSRVTYSEVSGGCFAKQTMEAKIGSARIAYRIDLHSNAGLTYYTLVWGGASEAKAIAARADELDKNFSFPAENSKWGKSAVPTRRSFKIPGYELSFFLRASVFDQEETEDDETLYSFSSRDQEHGCYGWIYSTGTTDSILDAAFEIFGDSFDEVEQTSREWVKVSGIQARRSVTFADDHYTIWTYAIPIDQGRILELRYLASGTPDTVRFDREHFARTLTVQARERVITFPELLRWGPAPSLDPQTSLVFTRATTVGDLGLNSLSSVGLTEDGIVACSGNAIASLPAGEKTAEMLLTGAAWGHQSIVRFKDQWLTSMSDGSVSRIRDGGEEPLLWEARALHVVGDQLFLAREKRGGLLDLLGTARAGGGDQIFRRAVSGSESLVAELPRTTVLEIVANQGGSQLLVRGSAAQTSAVSEINYGTGQLSVIEATTGVVKRFEQWQRIDGIGAATEGWIVSGRPPGKPLGIYQVDAEGNATALFLGGQLIGLGERDGLLTFASNRVPRSDGETSFITYRIPVASLAKIGPLCQPFSSQILGEIGRETMDLKKAAPGSETELRALFAKIQAECQTRVGRELPVDGVRFDSLIEEMYDGAALGDHGNIVLAIALAVVLLDQGGEWIETESARWLDWTRRSTDPRGNAFAIAAHPGSWISSCLYDEEGKWAPGTSIDGAREGRKLLVGLDFSALQKRIDAQVPAAIREALEKGDVGALRASVVALPKNHHWRDSVYFELSRLGRSEVIEELAAQFVEGEFASEVDHLAFWVARTPRAKASEVETLAPKLMKAIGEYPRAAALYLLLGRLYESGGASRHDHARASYLRLLEVQSWGDLADEARARIAALE